MVRTVRDSQLEKSDQRRRLTARPKPYWRLIDSGLHIGYRRTRSGAGTWIARRFTDDKKYLEKQLGPADDFHSADGRLVFNFSQAQGKAREWWTEQQRAALGIPVEGRSLHRR